MRAENEQRLSVLPLRHRHPNVSSANGFICLDILKTKWSPALTIKTALISLQALLASPEPDDPQDGVVAKQYLTDFKEYQKTAKEWTGPLPPSSFCCSFRSPLLRTS